MEQQSPEIDPHINGQLIFNRGASSIKMEFFFFLTNLAGTTGYLMPKKEYALHLIPYKKKITQSGSETQTIKLGENI